MKVELKDIHKTFGAVHANVGMGVGGVPMMENPPLDTVSRVSKALALIGKIDGL